MGGLARVHEESTDRVICTERAKSRAWSENSIVHDGLPSLLSAATSSITQIACGVCGGVLHIFDLRNK
jgi:hypothetical protein